MAKTYLTCKRCGNTAVIQRPGHSRRRSGHVKTMWCWRCKQVTQHTERH